MGNNNYKWLKQLYDLANKDKHDCDLSLQPEIDCEQIDMSIYLPELIDGVTELLLKLKYPGTALKDIQKLQFSQFVPLVVNALIPELESFGIFQNAANIHDTNKNQSTILKRNQI